MAYAKRNKGANINVPNWRMYASRDKLLRVACAASNAYSCASSNWCAAVPRVLRSHCARAELVRCFPVARGMAFEGIGFSDRASSPMGDTQTAVKVSSTTVRRLLTPFTLLGRRRQRSRGLVTIASLALLLATTPGASAEAPPSPPPMLPSAVCTTPGGYCLLSSGICSSASLVITTVSECEAAAVALELSDTTATLENQRVYLPPPPPSPPPRSLSPSPPPPSPPPQRSGDEPTPRPSKKTLASLAHELFETITFHSHRLLVRGKQPKKVSEARERRALTQASAAGFIPSAVEPALKATPEGSSASHPGVGGLSASPSSASPPSVRPCSTGKRLQGSPCTSLPVGPEGGPEGGFASQRSERRSCKFEERKPVLNGTELCEVQANKKTAFVSTPYPIFTGPKVRAPVASAPASLHNAPYHWHRLPRPLPLAPPPTPPTTGIASATTGTASATTGTASQGPLPLAPPPLPRSC